MMPPTPSLLDVLKSDDLNVHTNTEELSIFNIWKFLQRLADLSNNDKWLCEHISDVDEPLVPKVPSKSEITIGLVECLATDIRKHKTHLKRNNHIFFFFETTEIDE